MPSLRNRRKAALARWHDAMLCYPPDHPGRYALLLANRSSIPEWEWLASMVTRAEARRRTVATFTDSYLRDFIRSYENTVAGWVIILASPGDCCLAMYYQVSLELAREEWRARLATRECLT